MAYYLKKCIYNSPILEDGTVVYRSEWYDTKWTTHLEDKPEYATFEEAQERAIPLGCTVLET